MFGGKVAPAIAGLMADHYRLSAATWMAAAGALPMTLSGVLRKQTAPWFTSLHSELPSQAV
ncbi:MAG: hypothetical protein IRZ33_11490 [Alicyclobacillaceae bacterium]|nr:hypothetical protein [Alicyclobacillaceae bacterium]